VHKHRDEMDEVDEIVDYWQEGGNHRLVRYADAILDDLDLPEHIFADMHEAFTAGFVVGSWIMDIEVRGAEAVQAEEGGAEVVRDYEENMRYREAARSRGASLEAVDDSSTAAQEESS